MVFFKEALSSCKTIKGSVFQVFSYSTCHYKKQCFSINLLCAVLCPESLVVVTLQLAHHLDSFLDQFALDDRHQSVLLESLSGHVQREVIRVNLCTAKHSVDTEN